MRKVLLSVLLVCLLAVLCGCSRPTESAAVLPDLRLLERPVYADEWSEPVSAKTGEDVLRLDLWLDATQTMGGINPNRSSMYPHYSSKYREGGFHYRFGNETGLYEELLKSMLSASEASRVRILRYGNERLPDAFLKAEGLAEKNASADQLRSLRRDLLTYAVNPLSTVFADFSSERMTDSFYTLGTPMANQLSSIDERLLEPPEKAGAMEQALLKQLDSIRKGSDSSLFSVENDSDYALLYALDNLDLSRLSVITCDPASIRRLTTVDSADSPVRLIENLLKERGVFEQGLSVGLYAFTLDYMGQMSTFASADLSEPLLWGRLKYNNSKKRIEAALPMPRVLLTFVVGRTEQVEAYVSRLNASFSADVFAQPRGPRQNELTYTRSGETVTQEPFCFSWQYTQITRPVLNGFTQHSPGVTLSSSASVDAESRLVSLTAGTEAEITVAVPMEAPETKLTALSLQLEDALINTRTLSSTGGEMPPEDAQVIALRDRLYVYEHCCPEAAFELQAAEVRDGRLVFAIKAGSALEPGYYRLSLSADYADGAVEWETDPWIAELNADISSEEIGAWESFAQLITDHDRNRASIPRAFQHAWGPATDKLYHNQPYPDFPPVYKVPGLTDLVEQMQQAASSKQSPCLRYTFDVFINNP